MKAKMKKKVILSAFLVGVMCFSGCENSNEPIMTETEAVRTTSVLTTTQALKLDNSEYSEPKIIHTETMDELICNFLTALMNGDEEAYNACFKNGYGKKFDENYENYRRKLLENGYQKDHVFNLSEIKVFIAERPYDPTAYRSSATPNIYFPDSIYSLGLSIESDIDTELYYIRDVSEIYSFVNDEEYGVANGNTTRMNIDNNENFEEITDNEPLNAIVNYIATLDEERKATAQAAFDAEYFDKFTLEQWQKAAQYMITLRNEYMGEEFRNTHFPNFTMYPCFEIGSEVYFAETFRKEFLKHNNEKEWENISQNERVLWYFAYYLVAGNDRIYDSSSMSDYLKKMYFLGKYDGGSLYGNIYSTGNDESIAAEFEPVENYLCEIYEFVYSTYETAGEPIDIWVAEKYYNLGLFE